MGEEGWDGHDQGRFGAHKRGSERAGETNGLDFTGKQADDIEYGCMISYLLIQLMEDLEGCNI